MNPPRCLIWVALRPDSRSKLQPGEGRNTVGLYVRSFAILLRGFPSRRSLHLACIFESVHRLVQHRFERSPCARFERGRCARSRSGGVLVSARQVSGQRPAVGLSFGGPPQMLARGRREGRRLDEEAGPPPRRKSACYRSREERGRASKAKGPWGCTCGAIPFRIGGNVQADASRARVQGGRRSSRPSGNSGARAAGARRRANA